MKKNITRIFAAILIVSMLLTVTAFADEAGKVLTKLDLSETCALLIDYSYEDVPVAGAEFHIFPVADMDKKMHLTLSGDFADYPVEVNGLENEQFVKAANSLASYVALDNIKPMAIITTDAQGHAELKNLKAGLYLVIGQPLQNDEGSYIVENQLLFLPHADNTAGPWQYELTIKPKAEFVPTPVEPLKLQVIKVWDDKDSAAMYRPNEVTVHLLQNNTKYDTVVLNDANSWRHTWEELDPGYNWSVSEEVPVGYTVAITLDTTRFIITNTCKTPPPTTPPPPSIPQTGQLWWPVPVLMLVGVGLLAMGFAWRKDDDEA